MNVSGFTLPVPARFYEPLAGIRTRFGTIYTKLRCGGCRLEFTSLRRWEDHWSSRHGRRLEIRQWLNSLQRGITSWTKIRDPVKRAAARYRIDYKRHSFRVGLWYRNHPDVARRMEMTKLSRSNQARHARWMRARWRRTRLHCASCGSEIRRRELPAGVISWCPNDGFAWTWTDRELFLVAATAGEKSRATKVALGLYPAAGRKTWKTRRQRGHIAEDVRKLWRTRRARYGPTGISPQGRDSIARTNRVAMRRNWTNPSYRARQTEAIRKGARPYLENPRRRS